MRFAIVAVTLIATFNLVGCNDSSKDSSALTRPKAKTTDTSNKSKPFLEPVTIKTASVFEAIEQDNLAEINRYIQLKDPAITRLYYPGNIETKYESHNVLSYALKLKKHRIAMALMESGILSTAHEAKLMASAQFSGSIWFNNFLSSLNYGDLEIASLALASNYKWISEFTYLFTGFDYFVKTMDLNALTETDKSYESAGYKSIMNKIISGAKTTGRAPSTRAMYDIFAADPDYNAYSSLTLRSDPMYLSLLESLPSSEVIKIANSHAATMYLSPLADTIANVAAAYSPLTLQKFFDGGYIPEIYLYVTAAIDRDVSAGLESLKLLYTRFPLSPTETCFVIKKRGIYSGSSYSREASAFLHSQMNGQTCKE